MKDRSQSRQATIYDIAKAAGVSSATVSRALGSSGYPVSDSSRAKIQKVARELGYTPNALGRMLQKGETQAIGLVIPNISNPFYAQAASGIEQEAHRRGFQVLLCSSFRDPAAERQAVEALATRQIRGIVLASISEDHAYLQELQKRDIHFVTFDQSADDLVCSKVRYDFFKGGLLVAEHLIAAGHRAIAFLSAPLTRKSRRDILEGFRLTLLKHGLPLLPEHLLITQAETEASFADESYEFENGRTLANAFLRLQPRPSAILAINDMTAFGVIQSLSAQGVRVPDDVSVVGFDDILFASMFTPALTSVSQPSFAAGRLACRILLDQLAHPDQDIVTLALEPALVVRHSVAAPRIAGQATAG